MAGYGRKSDFADVGAAAAQSPVLYFFSASCSVFNCLRETTFVGDSDMNPIRFPGGLVGTWERSNFRASYFP